MEKKINFQYRNVQNHSEYPIDEWGIIPPYEYPIRNYNLHRDANVVDICAIVDCDLVTGNSD